MPPVPRPRERTTFRYLTTEDGGESMINDEHHRPTATASAAYDSQATTIFARDCLQGINKRYGRRGCDGN